MKNAVPTLRFESDHALSDDGRRYSVTMPRQRRASGTVRTSVRAGTIPPAPLAPRDLVEEAFLAPLLEYSSEPEALDVHTRETYRPVADVTRPSKMPTLPPAVWPAHLPRPQR